jgi:hypothetical protein
MLSGAWAHICARNLAVTTSFSFFVRCGIEMQVTPSSVLSPQLQLSPPYDAVALNSYFQIARELKDGYPSEYNDLGKMWDSISKVARRILPVVSLIPGAKIASGIASGVVDAGDAIRARRQAKAKKAVPQPSAAAVEIARRRKAQKEKRAGSAPRE